MIEHPWTGVWNDLTTTLFIWISFPSFQFIFQNDAASLESLKEWWWCNTSWFNGASFPRLDYYNLTSLVKPDFTATFRVTVQESLYASQNEETKETLLGKQDHQHKWMQRKQVKRIHTQSTTELQLEDTVPAFARQVEECSVDAVCVRISFFLQSRAREAEGQVLYARIQGLCRSFLKKNTLVCPFRFIFLNARAFPFWSWVVESMS